MNDTLRTIFDHIPKTGGTSITAALAQGFGERYVVQCISPHNIVVQNAGERRALCGHLWYYPGELLVSGWFYATLLRDPVDRFLSQYYFHRQFKQQVLDGSITDPAITAAVLDDSLESYLSHKTPQITRSYANVQAAHFAARICERPYELDEDDLLDAAVASLADYDLVGVYTEFGAFVDRYFVNLGVPRQELPWLNVTRERKFVHDISQQALRELTAANAVDLALVDWVRHHYSPNRLPSARTALATAANFGTREIEICSFEHWKHGETVATVRFGERIRLRVKCRSKISEADLTAGIAVHDANSQEVMAVNNKMLGLHLPVSANSEFVLRIEFNALFAAGDYQISIALVRGHSHLDRCFHWLSGAKRFRVESGQESANARALRVILAMDEAPQSRRWWHFCSRTKPTSDWKKA